MSDRPLGPPPKGTAAADWEAIYQADDAGWDLGEASPALVHLLSRAELHKPGARILVPGCGTGHDVVALAAAGYEAIGMDFAPSAVVAAQQRGDHFNIIQADALAEDNGIADHDLDLIFEHTFFCALQPPQRTAYAQSFARMLKTNGEVWALSMRTKFTNRQPYDSTPAEYIAIMQDAGFVCVAQEPMEPWSHERRKGRETFIRLRYEG